MCGIAGILNFDQQLVERSELQLMMKKMKHRGPDDEGVFIDDNLGLGFVRLSILDLSSAGHQPMFSHDNRFVIVFNGEVYNYIEIRDELNDKFQFQSGSDTEVILAAYQVWGKQCLDRFNGMFSFVIFDCKTKELFAARDRFGIKPFYYYYDDKRFLFASELKSLLPLMENKEPNDQIIYDYLLFNRTDHTQDTFFKGIKKLQHGSCITIANKKIEFKRWYDIREKIYIDKALSKIQYRELMKDSLKLRLRSDVPVGVSLSGGIDSSSIVAALLSDFKLYNINTFSAVFGKNEVSDESEFINQFKPIVKNMHFITPDAKSFFKDFRRFIDVHNEPVPDTNPYIQFKVMELASKKVTVTLDGQGADEQLAGYHYFFGSYFIELIKHFKLITFVKENIKYIKIHKSINAIKYFLYYVLPASLQNRINNQIFLSIDRGFYDKFKVKSDLNEMLYNPKSLNDSLLQHFEYKLEHLLRWEDLNAMHFSIESRVPFMDHRLVEATLSTPSNHKIRNGETKHLLREAMRDILPQKITNRKDKKGFDNPRSQWFKTDEFKGFITELITSEKFKNRGYFDSEIALIRYNKHLNDEIDISKEIWKWINLELWFRKFIDSD